MTDINEILQSVEQSRQELKQSEERFELAMRGTNDGLWDWNIRTNDAYFSPRWKSMLGYDEQDITNRFESWQNLIHPDDRQRARDTIQAYFDGAIPVYSLEHRLRHKDGTYRWILARGALQRDAAGQPYRMAGSHTDITERKQADAEIRRQNEFLAALHETTLGIMGRLDTTGLLEAIVDRAIKMVDCFYGWVYLLTPEKDALEATIGTGFFHRHLGKRLKRGEGLAGAVWQSGQPLAVANYQHWPNRSALYTGDPIGAGLGVPLRSGAEIVGVIGLSRSPGAPPFSSDEIAIMTRFSQLASIALDNARLHTSLQAELAERVHAEEALNERLTFERLIANISSDLINRAPEEMDAGIAHALAQVGRFSAVDRSYIVLLVAGGTKLRNLSEWCAPGITPQRPRVGEVLTADFPWLVDQIRRSQVVNIPRVADLPPEAAGEKIEFQMQECQSVFDVPIVCRGKVIGFMGFNAVRSPRALSQDSIALLRIVGEIFANALDRQAAQEALQGANLLLEERVAARTRELAALNAISAAVSRSLDLRQVMSDALAKTLDVMNMEVGAAYRLEGAPGWTPSETPAPQSACMTSVVYRGLSPEFMAIASSLPLQGSMAERTARQGRPILWRTEEYPNAPLERSLMQEGLQLAISVPLLVKGKLVGALLLASRSERVVLPEEVSMLAAIGQQIGVAVENARLYEEAESSAVYAERQRLARDLHDAVTQTLFSATLIADVLPRLWERRPDEGRRRLLELRELTRGALAEMRTMLLELRPAALIDIELADLLRQLAEAMMGRTRVPVALTVEGSRAVPSDVKVALYRIAQEALNNVAKHAGAKQVTLSLCCRRDRVELLIQDNGRGFVPAVVGADHLGLGIMRERAASVGATLQIESVPGAGTRVSVTWQESAQTS